MVPQQQPIAPSPMQQFGHQPQQFAQQGRIPPVQQQQPMMKQLNPTQQQ